MMKTESKARVFASIMSMIMMIPVVTISFILDSPFAILKWESIVGFIIISLTICVLSDLAWSLRKRVKHLI